MQTQILSNWNDFYSLGKEWNNLLTNSSADSIFLTWEWIKSWVKVIGESVQPFIVIVRNTHEDLIGLAPFYLSEYSLFKTLRYRTLRIMGDYATGSEYLDWIVRKDYGFHSYRAIAKTLKKYRDNWDCIWMPSVSGWSDSHDRILKASKIQNFSIHLRPTEFGYVDLPQNIGSYQDNLSRNMRSQLKRQTKKLCQLNNIKFSRCKTLYELPQYLNALFELHGRRWQKAGQMGTFKKKPIEASFYQLFSKTALENGWLWLFKLSLQGEIRAVQMGYLYNNIYHQMQEGFDPDYTPGTGNVLRSKVIDTCISQNIKIYDFLGGLTKHKERWQAQLRLGYDLFIGHRSMKNNLLFTKKIWPTGRFLRSTTFPINNTQDFSD